jgi:PAT family beta-lactamase induction signal transducer AmpG
MLAARRAFPNTRAMTSESSPAKHSPWAWVPTLYLIQGLPFAIVNSVSVIVYKSLGVSNADIAFYTAWLYLPWVIKPLWSPVVDILRTRRWWIWTTQLLMGAGFAGVGLTLPLPVFFQASLVIFYLVAFASATHDIAADGYYLLATTEQEQAFYVGIRSTFFRIANIFGQGLLVILAGVIQSNTGLPKVNVEVTAKPGVALVQNVAAGILPAVEPGFQPGGTGVEEKTSVHSSTGSAQSDANPGGRMPPSTSGKMPDATSELRVIVNTARLEISPEPRAKSEMTGLLAAAKQSNLTNQFTRVRKQTSATKTKEGPGWWSRTVSAPLEDFLRKHFGPEEKAKSDVAGNIGVVALTLSQAPGKEIVVTPVFKSGDKSIALAEGARLVFDDSNWNKSALAVIQLDPKLKTATSATFEIRSGNIALSWTITFLVITGLMAGFGLWHKFILPRPASDQPGDAQNIAAFIKEFFKTFGAFFAKERIGILIAFLLLYRFGESQLMKMVVPFLLDAREVGGLGLTTGQVGWVYGTMGIIGLTCGGLLGGMVASRHGLKAWLWTMVCIIHIPDAVFIYLAYAQPDNLAIVTACIALEQFGYGFGFTAYMLYMIYIARGKHQTAHYAICTGFMALGMMIPGMWSGWLQEIIGYQHFFLWVILATIPSFLVVLLIPLDKEFGKKA